MLSEPETAPTIGGNCALHLSGHKPTISPRENTLQRWAVHGPPLRRTDRGAVKIPPRPNAGQSPFPRKRLWKPHATLPFHFYAKKPSLSGRLFPFLSYSSAAKFLRVSPVSRYTVQSLMGSAPRER